MTASTFSTFDLLPDPVSVVAWGTGEIIFASRLLLECLHQQPFEVLGRTLHDVLGTKQPFEGVDLQTLYAPPPEQTVTATFEVHIGDKTEYLCLRGRHAIADDRSLVFFSLRNVTTEVNDRVRLIESERNYRLLAENSRDAIARVSIDGRTLYMSPSSLALNGYTMEELIGHSPFDRFHPDDISRLRETMRSLIETRTASTTTYRSRRKDGTWIWVETISVPRVDSETGRVTEIQTNTRDVTDRMLVQQAIREREAQLRQMFEVLAEGVIVFDRQYKVQYNNGAAARILGLPSDLTVPRTVRRLYKITNPDGSAIAATPAEGTFRDGEPRHQVELLLTYDDGGQVWVETSTAVVSRLADGTPELVLASFANITERVHRDAELKRATEITRQSEARYRQLAESSVDMISRHDGQGVYLYASEASKRIMGREPAELVGTSAFDYILPEDEQKVSQSLRQLLSGAGPSRVQFRVRHPDSSMHWLDSIAQVVPGTQPGIEIHVTSRDISDQRRLEARLEEIDAFNRAVFATISALVVVLDREGRIVLFNPACEEMTGWMLHEVHGKKFFDLFIPEEERAGVQQVFQRLAEGHFPSRHENAWITREGQRRWIAWANSITLDENGHVKFVIGTGIDRTDQRVAELALRDLNVNLEQLVTERTAALAASNTQLESFSYSVSHDLRAPLRAIDGFSRMLQEDYNDRLDDTGRDYIGRIHAATMRMASLIDDLLAMSRSARHEVVRCEVDLSALAREIIEGLRQQDPHREVEVVIRSGLHSWSDPVLTRTVLENLLSNAWKYTGRTEKAQIEMNLHTNGDLFVRDNGAGFDMKYVSKLFGAFQRLHRDHEFPGNGIGLATTRGIITRHGGSIYAEGEVNHGATFYFNFGPARG